MLVEHTYARRLVFLSRSISDNLDNADSVRELESLGSTVELVKVSVVHKEDVARAIQLVPNLKSILQASIVLCSETFSRTAYEDWNATFLKASGIWNLHEVACQAGVKLDFFILLSAMSGTTSLAGHPDYASADTFPDSFV